MSGTDNNAPRNHGPEFDLDGAGKKLKLLVYGPPRDLEDQSLFHKISLIALLAWVGLGADGLSSSSYGPEEAFRTLGPHTFLALILAAAVAFTVTIIASAYSRIIEEFPHGGGGYVVATKLLGRYFGVISGCALLVDYVLTIAVSLTSAVDALFSFLPLHWQHYKIASVVILIFFMMVINIRGVKESVLMLTPIFVVFLITHVALILSCLITHIPDFKAVSGNVTSEFHSGISMLGAGGMLLLFFHAYSLGAGTYTGLEAVSNGMPIIREPRVHNGRLTMLYMAVSLSFMAGGLLLCYYLANVHPVEGKTLNAVLTERLTMNIPFGKPLTVLTLISEAALLVVGAQAGFLDGPRVLANMAVDSWVPRFFSSLCERLTTRNGIMLMAGASLAVLFYTKGKISALVVMYSINVFITFSLSMLGMTRLMLREKRGRGKLALFVTGLTLCVTILVITIMEKFKEGGWVTVSVTAVLIVLCFLIRKHYRFVAAQLSKLFADLEQAVINSESEATTKDPLQPDEPTAAVLVAAYGGLGIHSVLNIVRLFPNYYKNMVFISVGVIDSGGFKGRDSIDELKAATEAALKKYVRLSRSMGIPADYRMAIGTDAVAEAERLCLDLIQEFPRTTFFGGKIIFREERWYERMLHNETAFAIQKRLQLAGMPMMIIPAKLT